MTIMSVQSRPPREPLGDGEQVPRGSALMAVLAARGRMLGGAHQGDLRAD
jgi:hypothetical protein